MSASSGRQATVWRQAAWENTSPDEEAGTDGALAREPHTDRGEPHGGDAEAAWGGARASGARAVPVHAARAAAVLGSGHRRVGDHAGAGASPARRGGRRTRRGDRRRHRPVHRRARDARARAVRRGDHLDFADARVALAAARSARTGQAARVASQRYYSQAGRPPAHRRLLVTDGGPNQAAIDRFATAAARPIDGVDAGLIALRAPML